LAWLIRTIFTGAPPCASAPPGQAVAAMLAMTAAADAKPIANFLMTVSFVVKIPAPKAGRS
jgi:hypothetical protein